MKNKILKSVLALCVVSTMVVGTVSTSLASDAIAAPESTEVTEEVTVGDVIDAIEDAEKEASDVIVSLPFGDVKETEKDVVADEENAAGDIQDATDIIADAEGKVEEALDGTDVSGEVDTASESVENALTDISDLNATIDAAIEKYGDADAFEFESSEQAKEVLDEVDAAYTAASEAYTTAQNDLTAAQEAVAAAQEKVDAAQAISDEALAEAEAELANAQAFLAVAEANAKEAYDRVALVSGILTKASDLLESWKNDVDGTIEDLKNSLEDSYDDLQDAIDELETEEKDFIDAITTFNEKYAAFITAADKFYNSVLDAAEKEAVLNEMKAAYEDALEAYNEAQAAFDACDKSDFTEEELEILGTDEFIINMQNAVEAAQEAYDAQFSRVSYLTEVEALKDKLVDGSLTADERKDVAKEIAELLIANELACGNMVTFDESAECYGLYDGIFVVTDSSDSVVARYGYKLDEENHVVNIYLIPEAEGFLTYKGIRCEIKKDGESRYIEFEGKQLSVRVEADKWEVNEKKFVPTKAKRKVDLVYHDVEEKDGKYFLVTLLGTLPMYNIDPVKMTADVKGAFSSSSAKIKGEYRDNWVEASYSQDAEGMTDSNKFDIAKENEKLEELLAAYDAMSSKKETAEELQELWTAMKDAESNYEDTDLGTLVNLPVSVADLFNTVKISNIDDLNAVMDAISTLTNSEAGIFSKTSAAIKLLNFVNVEGVDAKELAEAVLDKDSYKHEYVMAWLAALEAKGDVAKSAWDVVIATEETIVSGLVVISEGQQLGDAAVDVLLAQIKRDILEGSVSVLVIASDVLGAADSIVSSLEAKVSALEAETEEAYNAVLAAQEALDALKLTNPGQDAIDAAQAELDAANETLAALEEKLAEAETALLDAKDYRAEAEAEYEKLVESEDSDKDDTDDTDDKDDTDDADDIDDTDDVTTPGETVPGGTTPGETVPGGTTTPSVPESTPIANIINAAEAAPVVMPAPAVIAANPANAVANTPVATIDDEETPLAANDDEDDVEDEEETTEIEDEDTPLNATDTQVVPEVKKGFNWWWLLLLLIPVAGVTGYVIYKKKVQKVTTEE